MKNDNDKQSEETKYKYMRQEFDKILQEFLEENCLSTLDRVVNKHFSIEGVNKNG
jgi:hypothetical protein